MSNFFSILDRWAADMASPKIKKKRVSGPVEAVSAKFSGDLKVAHGDSATDEPKKSIFWAVEQGSMVSFSKET